MLAVLLQFSDESMEVFCETSSIDPLGSRLADEPAKHPGIVCIRAEEIAAGH